MSFCRFSTDDFQCDLYIYSDVHGGYTTHVAENRIKFLEPLPPKIELVPGMTTEQYMKWAKREAAVSKLIADRSKRVKIKHPEAGATYNDETLVDLLNRVVHLGREGFNFPSNLIERILQEAQNEFTVKVAAAIMRTRAGKWQNGYYKDGWKKGRDAAIAAVRRVHNE